MIFLNSCNNRCNAYKAESVPVSQLYTNGEKRCTVCAIYLKCDGYQCPCCGCRLRVRPKGRKSRANLPRI